jgi:hypothetical protein
MLSNDIVLVAASFRACSSLSKQLYIKRARDRLRLSQVGLKQLLRFCQGSDTFVCCLAVQGNSHGLTRKDTEVRDYTFKKTTRGVSYYN